MIYEGIDINAYSKMLNERFDKRVEVLKSKGYYYSKEHVGFAKTPKGFEIGNWISNGVIMHCEDFYFNWLLR